MNRAKKKPKRRKNKLSKREHITKCWEEKCKPKHNKNEAPSFLILVVLYFLFFSQLSVFYYLFYSSFFICLGLVQFSLALFYLQWHQPLALQMTRQLSTPRVILNLMVTPLILVGNGILTKTRERKQNRRNNKS